MLSIHHIVSVLSSEISTYGAGAFLPTFIYVWLAYYITGSIERLGFKIFWMLYALLHLYWIFQSNIILYDPFLYFAGTVLLLQVNFHKLLKRWLSFLQERAERKLNQCVARNMYYDSVEEKVRREEAIAREEEIKNKQQKRFLENLDKKLEKKFDFFGE